MRENAPALQETEMRPRNRLIEELKRLPKADLLKIAEFARQAVENRPLTPEQLGELAE